MHHIFWVFRSHSFHSRLSQLQAPLSLKHPAMSIFRTTVLAFGVVFTVVKSSALVTLLPEARRVVITRLPQAQRGLPALAWFADRKPNSFQGCLFAEPKEHLRTRAAATARFTRSYGESSREYRRTIYTHEDWLQHRSDDRLLDNLRGIFFSGIVRQLQTEVTLLIAIATSVLAWNLVAVPQLNLPLLVLPTLPFTLSSPALGLLLVFRTNSSYARWMEGRAQWGEIIAQSRNIVRMSCTFCDCPADSLPQLQDLADRVWLLSRCIMNTMSSPEDELQYEQEIEQAFPDENQLVQHILVLDTRNRALAALTEVSMSVDDLPIDEKRRVEIDKSLVIVGNCISKCEIIYRQPVPLVYTRHTARFLSLWMILLPLGLYSTLNSWILVPTIGILSLFLFGIEELAVQLEEPFSILPMKEYCDDIRTSTLGIIDWTLGRQLRS